jgi:ribonuclease Z
VKKFVYKSIRVLFKSTGGIESCYILPDFKIAFDVGRCPTELVDIPSVFVSHGHLDHASGIAYYFSQRSLKNLGPGVMYVPDKILSPLTKITQLWQEIEEFNYKSNLVGLKPGDSVEISKDVNVMPIPAIHRVSAYGYVVVKTATKLKTQYLNLSGKEIARRRQTEDLFNVVKQPVFAYSGDSAIEIIKDNEMMRKATVLFMECTYIDEKRNVERARKWGHTHLDEIIENAGIFENEKVVLVHLSRRYSPQYIQSVLQKKLPPKLRDKFIYVE